MKQYLTQTVFDICVCYSLNMYFFCQSYNLTLHIPQSASWGFWMFNSNFAHKKKLLILKLNINLGPNLVITLVFFCAICRILMLTYKNSLSNC